MIKLVHNSWNVPIGQVSKNKWVYFNFLDIPHIKIAGVTKSGKSAFLQWLLYVLLRQQDPDNIIVYVIDLKGGATFAVWEHHPAVAGVYVDIQGAYDVLNAVREEMERRNEVTRLRRYNFQSAPKWPQIVVVIDEGGEMSPKGYRGAEKTIRDNCMSTLSSLARVGREPGIHVVYGTQRPDADTLPTHIRSQLEITFCFRVKENIDSQIVLRHNGAEQLPLIPGRMIFQTPDREVIVQAPYLSEKLVMDWLKFYANKPEASAGSRSNMSTPTAPGLLPGF